MGEKTSLPSHHLSHPPHLCAQVWLRQFHPLLFRKYFLPFKIKLPHASVRSHCHNESVCWWSKMLLLAFSILDQQFFCVFWRHCACGGVDSHFCLRSGPRGVFQNPPQENHKITHSFDWWKNTGTSHFEGFWRKFSIFSFKITTTTKPTWLGNVFFSHYHHPNQDKGWLRGLGTNSKFLARKNWSKFANPWALTPGESRKILFQSMAP